MLYLDPLYVPYMSLYVHLSPRFTSQGSLPSFTHFPIAGDRPAPKINIAPLTAADRYTASFNALVAVYPLLNDTDPDIEQQLNVAAWPVAPKNGTLFAAGQNNGFWYVPRVGVFGTDTFKYAVSDGVTTSDGVVTITIGK